MKEPKTAFSFKKNTEVNALPDAKPKAVAAPKPVKVKKKAAPKPQKEQKTRAISAYLTDEEYEAFSRKLDGRVASATVRSLILKYIETWTWI